jgi:hypothetical protein
MQAVAMIAARITTSAAMPPNIPNNFLSSLRITRNFLLLLIAPPPLMPAIEN